MLSRRDAKFRLEQFDRGASAAMQSVKTGAADSC